MVRMRSIKIGIVAVGLTAGSCGAYWGAIQYQGNFHAVKEGAFYRSAQLSKDELQSTIREHKIRSVLNLRGAHPGQAWYDEELAVSQALGVAHYDYALSSHRFVTRQQIGRGARHRPRCAEAASGALQGRGRSDGTSLGAVPFCQGRRERGPSRPRAFPGLWPFSISHEPLESHGRQFLGVCRHARFPRPRRGLTSDEAAARQCRLSCPSVLRNRSSAWLRG